MSVPNHEPPAAPDVTTRLRELVEGGNLSGRDKTRILDALVATCFDLTRARRDRDALKAELATALAAHKAFAYSVSHDLSAPLRAIDGFARMLSERPRGEWDAEAERFLGIICANAKTMNDQLAGLLHLSRLEHQDLRCMVVDMTDVARAVVDDVRSHEPERQVAVSIAALEAAFADLAMMSHVFTELVTNAWKFTRVRASATVEISSHTRGTENVYVVRDDGVGFAPAAADRLFAVFRRLHKPDEFEGLGVGLAAVRAIVTRHRGRVWAEGEPRKGATFCFSLPRASSAGDGEPPPQSGTV